MFAKDKRSKKKEKILHYCYDNRTCAAPALQYCTVQVLYTGERNTDRNIKNIFCLPCRAKKHYQLNGFLCVASLSLPQLLPPCNPLLFLPLCRFKLCATEVIETVMEETIIGTELKFENEKRMFL